MLKENITTLGLNIGPHDTTACIVQNGVIVVVGEEERFDRERHSHNFPVNAIKFCLEKANISDINTLDTIAVGYDWMERGRVRFDMRFSKERPDLTIQAVDQMLTDFRRIPSTQKFFEEIHGYKGKVKFYDHYDCHASSAYYPSPFNKSAILVIDGAGEKATARIYKADGAKLTQLLQIDYPNSVGRFYGWVTDYLGFRIDADEGKTMGLASYGTEKLLPQMRKLVQIKEDGTYELNMEYFNFQHDSKNGLSEKFFDEFGPRRVSGDPITEHHQDIARSAQIILEEAVLAMAGLAKKLTNEKYLCMSGGVVLNSVANGKVVASGLFDDIYIYPTAGDTGTAIGAALHGYYSGQTDKIFHKENQSPYMGYEATDAEIVKALEKYKLTYSKPDNLAVETAKLIAENKVVAWYQGKAEIGPRALGDRSILADPRKAENKDLVNKVKMRENFRPFAPSILEGFENDYFEMNNVDSPYMILTQIVKQEKRSIIPAVTHVDGTARAQVVHKENNEKYWNVINEFNKLTGVPVILNTSFNRGGEPIVNTPEHAIESFLGSALDVLIVGDYIVIK